MHEYLHRLIGWSPARWGTALLHCCSFTWLSGWSVVPVASTELLTAITKLHCSLRWPSYPRHSESTHKVQSYRLWPNLWASLRIWDLGSNPPLPQCVLALWALGNHSSTCSFPLSVCNILLWEGRGKDNWTFCHQHSVPGCTVELVEERSPCYLGHTDLEIGLSWRGG